MATAGFNPMAYFADLNDEELQQASGLLASPSDSTSSIQTTLPMATTSMLPAGALLTPLDEGQLDWSASNDDMFSSIDVAGMPSQSWDFEPQLQQQACYPSTSAPEPNSGITPGSLYMQPEGSGGPYAQPALPKELVAVLTPAQAAKLQSIAMPSQLKHSQSPTYTESPASLSNPTFARSSSSPDAAGPAKRTKRKRKDSADLEAEEDDDDEEVDGSSPQPAKKTTHNMIEKRYRTNINDKIAALRDSVPALRIMSKSAKGEDVTEDKEALSGLAPAHKLNKATVLSKATEYIRHLEKRNTRLADENKAMQQRLAAFERLVMAGAMNGTMNAPSRQTATTSMPFTQIQAGLVSTALPTSSASAAPGMIPVPDGMKRILAQQMAAGRPYPVPQQAYQHAPAVIRQQQIQQTRQTQAGNGWSNAGPYMGKLMVGSLAGLMILEALRENESSNERTDGRGLFALPVQLFGSLISSSHVSLAGYVIPAAKVIHSAKMLAVLGLFLWIFIPSLFAQRPPKSDRARLARESLQAAPSLASPIHIRRRAWLTAIQTVWVPRHNFFLEAAALILKTAKLSLRSTIGVQGYQWLTGLTEEQERARIKGWDCALDSQLAGGDVEINKSRLTLTLLASGTLPDTPQRLMLKALHTRVLLWQPGSCGVFSPLARIFATEVSKAKWTEAKHLERMVAQLRKTDQDTGGDDDLPEHLAVLLQQECHEVLSKDVIQRAYNLAWNHPTRQGVRGLIDGMDAVVEDPAVRSPMDAVAAWYSCTVLHGVLARNVLLPGGFTNAAVQQNLWKSKLLLAAKAAPIGSLSQARAYVARAVLIDEDRAASIATALQEFASPPDDERATQGIVAHDLDTRLALQCAIAVERLRTDGSSSPNLSREAIAMVDVIASGLERSNMSLLCCTAAYRLMALLQSKPSAYESCSGALERLAGTLRIWIGSAPGEEYSLDDDVRLGSIQTCLAVAKRVVGMAVEGDPGYASMSDDSLDLSTEGDSPALSIP